MNISKSFYNLAMFVDGKARNMPNVLKLWTEEVYNLAAFFIS